MRISDWSSDVCSSDLCCAKQCPIRAWRPSSARCRLSPGTGRPPGPATARIAPDGRATARCCRRCTPNRSEEHTSELQSLMRISYAVFCLKKKNTTNQINKYKTACTKDMKHKFTTNTRNLTKNIKQ